MPLRTAQPVKVVGSTKNYQWDFTSDLAVGETLVAASVTMTVYSGSDPAPQTMVSGNASIAGNIVTQLLTGGLIGVVYQALCQVTTSLGQTLQQISFIVLVGNSP